MANLSLIAQLAVGKAAETRQKYGIPVVIGAGTFLMMTRTLVRKESELIPEGIANAGANDLRLFNASPADFPVLPLPESLLLWEGVSYTVIFAVLGDPVGGTYASARIFAYRTPAPASATDSTDAEQRAEDAAAGTPDAVGAVVVEKRKSYSPGPSNL